MNAAELRAKQAPLKAKYKEDAAAAFLTLKIEGTFEPDLVCRVASPRGPIDVGLHPAAGGSGSHACSGDMLLEALVGCAGVTLRAVATALEIPLKGGTISAEGDLDFRGTLGVSKEVPVGFKDIRLTFRLDADATPEQLENLIKLTKRYCVIYQTLIKPATVTETIVQV